MEFKVPQYIDVEDKIFGPFTLKQFLYIGGGGGASFLLWRLLPTFLAILFIVPVAGFAWALAFYPKEKFGKPFVEIVESAFKFLGKAKLYTWKKNAKPAARADDDDDIPATNPGIAVPIPRVGEGKLGDLSWSVDVKSGEREGE